MLMVQARSALTYSRLDVLAARVRLYLISAFIFLAQILRTLCHHSTNNGKQYLLNPRSKSFGTAKPVIIVTGAGSGIGRSISSLLRSRGYRVLLLLHAVPQQEHPACTTDTFAFDLADMPSILRVTRSIARSLPKGSTCVLINAAGALHTSHPFRVNLLGPLILALYLSRTSHLIGALWLGSAAVLAAKEPILTDISRMEEMPAYAAYPLAKALLIPIAANCLDKDVPSIVVHPGVVFTRLYEKEPGLIGSLLRIILRIFAWKPMQAAERVLQVAEMCGVLDGQRMSLNQLREDICPTYWDATTMRPGLEPKWLRDRGLQTQLARVIGEQISGIMAEGERDIVFEKR